MLHGLEKEFQFYLDNQDDIVAQHDGKVVVIKDCQLLGVYDDEGDAVIETRKEHTPGTFLVQRVSEGSEAYTATFHSRVALP